MLRMLGLGGGVSFDPAKEIPDLSGKVILVTGGNSGLGAECIKQIAKHNPSELWLTARTRSTAESAVEAAKAAAPNANITILDLELGDFSSVAAAAETFKAKSKRLDVMILNAGIAFAPPGLSKEGYELHLGGNHMGHALLTKLLLPTMLSTAGESPSTSDVRIVVVSSEAHRVSLPNGIDFESLKTEAASSTSLRRYGQSKLANTLFADALAKRYPAIKTMSVHPGTVATPVFRIIKDSAAWKDKAMNFAFNLVAIKVEDGALNQLWAAFAASEKVKSGAYYQPVGKLSAPSNYAKDKKLADKFWDWTETELSEKGWAGWP